MTDWVTTFADMATGGGTLVLAVATFASVRSANRAARTAEVARRAGMRPVIMNSRLQDATQKIMFGDGTWVAIAGGSAAITVTDDNVYLAISVRNAGTGMGILHGWRIKAGREMPPTMPSLDDFTPQGRDMYVAPAEAGFWQGRLQDPSEVVFKEVCAAIEQRDYITLDLLYGDYEGGQRVISRFSLAHYEPADNDQRLAAVRDPNGGRDPAMTGGRTRWLASVTRHWNVDLPNPRGEH